MPSISWYDKLKYIKSELRFWNENENKEEVLIGGKGYLQLGNPPQIAKNWMESVIVSDIYDTKLNRTTYENANDYFGIDGKNLMDVRKLGYYPIKRVDTGFHYYPILLLYTEKNSGLYVFCDGETTYTYGILRSFSWGVFINGNIRAGFPSTSGVGKFNNSISFLRCSISIGLREDGVSCVYCDSGQVYFDKAEEIVYDIYSVNGTSTQYTNDLKAVILPYMTDTYNPYEDGGDSEDGGGDGDFDNTSEDIEVPSLPTLSATASGFVNIFNPTLAQLNQLASYMWTSDFYDNIVKLWADPMSVILGLSVVPVSVPSDDLREVKCGNISTGVQMYHASTQFVVLDCGTINVNEYWGAYLDYSPYTKIQLYLPYCGTHSLDIDDIMGRSINITYHIDILSGSCVAFVKSIGKGLNSVLYEFSGNVSTQIPVTGENFSRLIQTAISSVASLGSTVATGGLSAPMAISTMGSLASNVANSKPEIERSGSMSGSTGLMGIQKPYLILTRPKQCIPKDVQKFKGFPSMKFQKLSDVKGFTIISEILLKNITATDEEINEIKRLLKEGVIL